MWKTADHQVKPWLKCGRKRSACIRRGMTNVSLSEPSMSMGWPVCMYRSAIRSGLTIKGFESQDIMVSYRPGPCIESAQRRAEIKVYQLESRDQFQRSPLIRGPPPRRESCHSSILDSMGCRSRDMRSVSQSWISITAITATAHRRSSGVDSSGEKYQAFFPHTCPSIQLSFSAH
jgi:hypothetical protein